MAKSTPPIILRDYQRKTVDQLCARDSGRTLVVAPTGAGKGTMAAELLARMANGQQRAIFVVHRREIIRDVIRRLSALGVTAADTQHSHRMVRVLSVQAALRMSIVPVHMLVIDEAHHYAAEEWTRIIEVTKPKRIVGFTATPSRADGKALGRVFDELVESIDYATLIERKLIVPCRVLRPVTDLHNRLAIDPAEAYMRFGRGERALIFARTRSEAKAITAKLTRKGVRAKLLTGETKADQRDAMLRELEEGVTSVVVNVRVLTEGFDAPHVATAILACPCAHVSTYTQIVGRVLRAAPGKKEATLIDLVGASHRHGLPGQSAGHELTVTDDHVAGPRDSTREEAERAEPAPVMEVVGADLEEVRWVKLSPSELRKREEARARAEEVAAQKLSKQPQSSRAHPTYEHEERFEGTSARGLTNVRLMKYRAGGDWCLGWVSKGGTEFVLALGTRIRSVAMHTQRTLVSRGVVAARKEVETRKNMFARIALNRITKRYELTFVDWSLTDDATLESASDDGAARISVDLYTESEWRASEMLAMLELGEREKLDAAIRQNKKGRVFDQDARP